MLQGVPSCRRKTFLRTVAGLRSSACLILALSFAIQALGLTFTLSICAALPASLSPILFMVIIWSSLSPLAVPSYRRVSGPRPPSHCNDRVLPYFPSRSHWVFYSPLSLYWDQKLCNSYLFTFVLPISLPCSHPTCFS